MRAKFLYLIYLLMASGTLTISGMLMAQDVGLRPAEIRALKDSLQATTADNSLLKLYDAQRRLADQSLTEDPHPIDTIRTEGLLQGNPKKTATQQALRDMRKMYALALVYKVSGDRKYLSALERYIEAWAAIDRPRGDPIDDTNLDPVIEAYDMVKGDLAPSTAETVRGIRDQIARNLNPDGSSSDFVARDALHYHVYDLEPLLRLAIVLERATGVNYYTYVSPAGTSIKKSVDWLLPYLTGEKTHGEFINSTVEFDRQRARNGEAAYKAGTLFDPKNGIPTLLLAAYFDADPELMPLARKLSGTEDRYPGWQAVVNALMGVDGK